jgi:chloramphenicol 3-O-phosphotransferase
VADRSNAHAVVITGAYGTGKTSLVEEIADILEERGDRYGALDLDRLAWFDPGFGDHSAARPLMLKNVDAVVGNYYDTGVRRFALAGWIASTDELEGLRVALGMPLTVVRLTLPIEEIEHRLSSSIAAGRENDLRVAREWLAEGRGDGIGDLVIENDRQIREVALEILSALRW